MGRRAGATNRRGRARSFRVIFAILGFDNGMVPPSSKVIAAGNIEFRFGQFSQHCDCGGESGKPGQSSDLDFYARFSCVSFCSLIDHFLLLTLSLEIFKFKMFSEECQHSNSRDRVVGRKIICFITLIMLGRHQGESTPLFLAILVLAAMPLPSIIIYVKVSTKYSIFIISSIFNHYMH